MARVLISAAHKSSGKTTLSIGLCAALRARGLTVQPFKKGPDYIDPMWLSLAAGRACRNLDFFMMEREEIARDFARHAAGADIALIEGNKGLYDGLSLDCSNSNAALAALLAAQIEPEDQLMPDSVLAAPASPDLLPSDPSPLQRWIPWASKNPNRRWNPRPTRPAAPSCPEPRTPR